MTAPLRILVASDTSPVAVEGGGERVLWEQASRLARSGHDVRVVARALRETLPETVELEGIRIRHFRVDRRSMLGFLRSAMLEARRAALRELAERDADVLHLYQPLSAYGVLRSAAGRRIPSLYTFLSSAPLEYRSRRGMTPYHRGGWAGGLITVFLWLIEGACLKRATRIHVLSDFSAKVLWKLYRISPDRLVKIPGGVDTERFQPVADRRATRKALGLPASGPLLFTIRNLEARMGLDALIRATGILRRRLPDVLVLLGGAGSRREELESLAASLDLKDHVRFLGFVPEEQLPRYYQAADAFVLPTRELEGFGLVTVEALACGTPVLGTAVGATPEILRPLDPRLMFRDTRPEAMADDLRRFLDADGRDPAAGQRLRQACRDHATAHYRWDDAVGHLERTLQELANRRGVPADPVPTCRGDAEEEGP